MEMHEEHEDRINWPFDISANLSPPLAVLVAVAMTVPDLFMLLKN